MILFDSSLYRVVRLPDSPKPFALDRKERLDTNHVCLVNVGWYDCEAHALSAMADDYKQRKLIA